MLGICDAMRHLHKQGIFHRDLKPENILLDKNYYPRVCDFGFSRCFSEVFSRSLQLSMSGKVGTPLYMAPEMLITDDSDEEGNKGHFGFGIDVYSFAIMAYEIVSGKEPFSENGNPISYFKLISKVASGQRPKLDEGITEQMKELLKRCWSQDIEKRPSFDEIFNELSSNFDYLVEDVDEKEIKN